MLMLQKNIKQYRKGLSKLLFLKVWVGYDVQVKCGGCMPRNQLCSSLLWALGCQIKCRNSFKKGFRRWRHTPRTWEIVPALTDIKPSELLRSRKALTHGELQAFGDTELLAAAQLIMPSHPLKAIVLWNRNRYPMCCYKLSQGVTTLYHPQSEEQRDVSAAPGAVGFPSARGNVQVGSVALVDPAIRSKGGSS